MLGSVAGAPAILLNTGDFVTGRPNENYVACAVLFGTFGTTSAMGDLASGAS